MNLRELLILISRNRATEVHLAVNAPIELRIDRPCSGLTCSLQAQAVEAIGKSIRAPAQRPAR
jgi:Tfp pilus assembly pilus retraction ATPase PilT